MKQDYPGDIAPLMHACAELARRRAADLQRVRATVQHLKTELASTLLRFTQAREVSVARSRKSLGAFRAKLRADVQQLKAQTQTAKGLRFRSGAFKNRALPRPAVRVGAADSAPSAPVDVLTKRSRPRSFLDL